MSHLNIIWFRKDLRLADNPAVTCAIADSLQNSTPLLPIFLWNPVQEAPWEPGAASRWWLAQSLQNLNERLKQMGSKLFWGNHLPLEQLLQLLLSSFSSIHLYYNQRIEPAGIHVEKNLMAWQKKHPSVQLHSFHSNYLYNPTATLNKTGLPYRVFTPYYRHVSQFALDITTLSKIPSLLPPPPVLAQNLQTLLASDPDGMKATIAPTGLWSQKLANHWLPGEVSAWQRLKNWPQSHIAAYPIQRDIPKDPMGTSMLSAHLAWGELNPTRIYSMVQNFGIQAEPYLRQLIWREFSACLLYYFPYTTQNPFQEKFQKMSWNFREDYFKAWCAGQTGFAWIDAGMTQLWQTGWMHNRVRMAVASFLVKNMGISWVEGARWFWDTLVDADLANNTMGWQWTAGCGVDASPWYRIFNPTLQQKKFDPNGQYCHKWAKPVQVPILDYPTSRLTAMERFLQL
jgi:deoxyribodipyrimidine photo-lyase